MSLLSFLFLAFKKLPYGSVHVYRLAVFHGDNEAIGKLVENGAAQPLYLIVVGRGTIGVSQLVAIREVLATYQSLEERAAISELLLSVE